MEPESYFGFTAPRSRSLKNYLRLRNTVSMCERDWQHIQPIVNDAPMQCSILKSGDLGGFFDRNDEKKSRPSNCANAAINYIAFRL
jgi:hypothetical protein